MVVARVQVVALAEVAGDSNRKKSETRNAGRSIWPIGFFVIQSKRLSRTHRKIFAGPIKSRRMRDA